MTLVTLCYLLGSGGAVRPEQLVTLVLLVLTAGEGTNER